MEVCAFGFLLSVHSQSKEVPKRVREVVELGSGNGKVELGCPEHRVVGTQRISVPALPCVLHGLPQVAGCEGFAVLPVLVDLGLEVEPGGNVQKEGNRGLRVIPTVLQLLLGSLGHINEIVSNNRFEENGGSLGQIHGVSGLSPLHVPHNPAMKGMPELMRKGADVLEGPRVGRQVYPGVPRLCEARAVGSWPLGITFTALNPLLV
mmetsp:Transcript_24040/g.37704  ORF Transcript_24040/g.37704 Transcript_24040/m.37704 type:complete len:206 (+) Transcript_24040:300-917(+)